MENKTQKDVENLDNTMVFQIDENKDTKEMNVIKEKNLVVDFTEPVEVLSDTVEDKKKKKNKKTNNKKMKFKPLVTFKKWWSGLSKIKKFVICLITFLVIVLIVLLILVLTKGDSKKSKEKLPDVVVEEENYTYKNGTLIFTNNAKEKIGSYECKNKDEKKCYVAYRSNEDNFSGEVYLNQDGSKLETRSSVVFDNYVFIVDNKKGSNDDIILYSLKSKAIVDKYKLVKQSQINKKIAILKDKDDKYGVLDLEDDSPKTLINFVYNYAGVVNNEMANKYIVLSKNGKNYVTDFNENLLSSGFTDEIVDYNDEFIVTKSIDNIYKIYNYEGTELTPNNYLYIKIMQNYYAALLDNGLIVYDKDGTKYNEMPIGLTSTNYDRTYVFDANKQVISNDVAFEMEVNEEYVSITRGKANDLLSITDAIANKDRAYISYFNGILYFYGDAAKTNLLGKYTCKNKNTVGTLDHCMVASSVNISKNDLTYDVQSGVIGILNNRFVFINDTAIGTPSIYLYDLSVSKKLGPYSEVEIVGLIGPSVDLKTTDGAYIIAKNSKNQYGLLKVNATSVDFILNFEYSLIEKSGDNYIAQKSNDKFVIVGKDGKELSKEIDGKIMSYNDKYITAKNTNGYVLYDYNGTRLDNKAYTFIKLDKYFYVAIVNNNRLEVHEYSDPAKAVKFDKEIVIKSSDSWRNSTYYKVERLIGQLDATYVVRITDGENDATYASIKDEVVEVDNKVENNQGNQNAENNNSQENEG